jgi:hypothetical protein
VPHPGTRLTSWRSDRRRVVAAAAVCMLIIVLAPPIPLLILLPLVVLSLFATWQQVAGVAVAAAALTLVVIDGAGSTSGPGTTAEIVLAGGLGAAAVAALRRFRDNTGDSRVPSAWLHTADGQHLLTDKARTCLVGPSTVVLWLPIVDGVRLVVLTAPNPGAELRVDVPLVLLMLHEAMPMPIAAETLEDVCERADPGTGALLADVSGHGLVSTASVGGSGSAVLIDSNVPRLLDPAAAATTIGGRVQRERHQLDAHDRLIVRRAPGHSRPTGRVCCPVCETSRARRRRAASISSRSTSQPRATSSCCSNPPQCRDTHG